jgi:hypothetical protein
MFFFTEAIIRIYLEDWFSNEQNFVKLGIIFYQEKTPLQGDQIGRIFAQRVILCFRSYTKMTEVARIFGPLYSTVKSMH